MKGEISRGVLIALVMTLLLVLAVYVAMENVTDKSRDAIDKSERNTDEKLETSSCQTRCLQKYGTDSRVEACISRCKS